MDVGLVIQRGTATKKGFAVLKFLIHPVGIIGNARARTNPAPVVFTAVFMQKGCACRTLRRVWRYSQQQPLYVMPRTLRSD